MANTETIAGPLMVTETSFVDVAVLMTVMIAHLARLAN